MDELKPRCHVCDSPKDVRGKWKKKGGGWKCSACGAWAYDTAACSISRSINVWPKSMTEPKPYDRY